jgi:hypothetical protein
MAASPSVVICTESFVGSFKGAEVECHKGDVLSADDPVAKHWSQFFEAPAARTRAVEQATAAPGEQRDAPAGKALTTASLKGK